MLGAGWKIDLRNSRNEGVKLMPFIPGDVMPFAFFDDSRCRMRPQPQPQHMP
jgi:hypothetical protein